MEAGEYDALLRTLAGIAAHQETLHADLRELLHQQAGTIADLRKFNPQPVAINAAMDALLARIDTTLARMKTILARIRLPGERGREA